MHNFWFALYPNLKSDISIVLPCIEILCLKSFLDLLTSNWQLWMTFNAIMPIFNTLQLNFQLPLSFIFPLQTPKIAIVHLQLIILLKKTFFLILKKLKRKKVRQLEICFTSRRTFFKFQIPKKIQHFVQLILLHLLFIKF